MSDEQNAEVNEWKNNLLSKGLLALTGDGWTNRRRAGCVNIKALTSSGVVNYETYCCGADRREANAAEFIANIFNTAIDELGGTEKVVGIVTDNEAKMRNAWRIVEATHPGIAGVALPCGAHVGNLLMKDIGAIQTVHKLIKKVHRVSDHVLNRSFPLAQRFFEKK